jgi:hypothetical protein
LAKGQHEHSIFLAGQAAVDYAGKP